MTPVLQPYLRQSALLRSIAAFGFAQPFWAPEPVSVDALTAQAGDHAALLVPTADTEHAAGSSAWLSFPLRSGHGVTQHPMGPGEIAAAVVAARGAAPGLDVLLAPVERLATLLACAVHDFPWRAAVAIAPAAGFGPGADALWQLQRDLFDRGLVLLASLPLPGCTAHCFLASDAVQVLPTEGRSSRGRVTMSSLGQNGRFANQLVQYAYVRFYALRHGLTAAFPPWDGRQLFSLDDPYCTGADLPRLAFSGFSDDDRALWECDDPPINIDLHGYFQETPSSWRAHRQLLRTLFQLPREQVQAIDAWRHRVTDGGQRTLVAVHVRRGDYRVLQHALPWLRLVPEQWYLTWLRELWPTLRHPVLFVATDEPGVIRPLFVDFEQVSVHCAPPADALAEHIRDFEMMRRADYLAQCNSSFSRMAAMLAPTTQRCYIPSFAAQRFLPCDPWIDPAFWARFQDASQGGPTLNVPGPAAAANTPRQALHAPAPQVTTILFDVTDLVLYLMDHVTLTGIQRVQSEILRNLVALVGRPALQLVVLSEGLDLMTVDTPALMTILGNLQSTSTAPVSIAPRLRELLRKARPCSAQAGELFVTIGAFWNVRGMGQLLRGLQASGVRVAALIHDLLPFDTPEYFDALTKQLSIKGVFDVLPFTDFVLTTTAYSSRSLARVMGEHAFPPVPIRVLPLARELTHTAPPGVRPCVVIQEILGTDYVLCVGTIEVRKNPTYLFHLWKMLLQSGRDALPRLVFVGRRGWLVRDFMDQLAATGALDGSIVLLHDVTDDELDLLYRNCLLTMFPSLAEGWGLPVGESLAHGKVCLCSAVGGIREAGGTAADYIDPYNVRDGYAQLTRYLDHPELLHAREREIAECFAARSWRTVAEDFLAQSLALAREVPTNRHLGAIPLPAGHYLAFGSEAAMVALDGVTVPVSTELACAAGWHAADASGVRATGPIARLRFRTAAPVGARIVLVLRLAAQRRAFPLQLRSGSGAMLDVTLDMGVERSAMLSCVVEPGHLVSVELSTTASASPRGKRRSTGTWNLKGLLYFEPARLTAATVQSMQRGESGMALAGAWSVQRDARAGPRVARSRQSAFVLPAAASLRDNECVSSLREFRSAGNRWWPTSCATTLAAPLLADREDRQLFASAATSGHHTALQRSDEVRLVRRSDLFLSTARFSEGSLFDRAGVWRGGGFLTGAPRGDARWLSVTGGQLQVDAAALARAPLYEGSWPIFYNGNLHNYYHWLAEGLLGLDVLTQAMGDDADLRIALPQSMDIAAALDHRGSMAAIGLGKYPVTEVPETLVRVREAIWVETDLVETMPPHFLEAFQRRVYAHYADVRGPAKRRLFVARKGPTRTLANVAAVEALLADHGFATVYLEGMSMTEQILLFQRAEFIIGPHGAALANLLFCQPGTKVIEFMPTAEFRPFFWLISAKLGLTHGIQFCPTTASQGFQGTLHVDVAKLRTLMRMAEG